MKWLGRPTERTPLVLLLFIVGGAIINVAVAWGCAYNDHNLKDIGKPSATELRYIMAHQHMIDWSMFEPMPATSFTRGSFGLKTVESFPQPDGLGYKDEPEYEKAFGAQFRREMAAIRKSPPFITQVKCGWPQETFVGYHACAAVLAFSYSPFLVPSPSLSAEGGLEVSRRLIPYEPIWSGFAINTIFYAAILSLLFAAHGNARRRIRIKRGLCPACAYPVGVSNICTECGRPLRLRKSSMASTHPQ